VDAETLYRQIGRLLEAMPDFSGFAPMSSEQFTWLGRAEVLVGFCKNTIWIAEYSIAAKSLQGPMRRDALETIKLIVYKALAHAEMEAPPSAQGAFIPAGNRFDAFAALTKVLQTANKDVFLVDPYLDETVLTDFAGAVVGGATIRLLSDEGTVKPTLVPASKAWVAQNGLVRPLNVRMAPPRTLHDRAIFVDGATGWLLTQSLKDFAKRSAAEIVRADDTAALKIAAYESIWLSARVIV
jgi:hypothetical protein